MKVLIRSLGSVCRYSAIRCASAVPMSSVELQQARANHQAPAPEPEHKKTVMNGEANVASKPSTKPQKGIMGMFSNKAAPKSQDIGKDLKSEQKEDAPVVRLCCLCLMKCCLQRNSNCCFYLCVFVCLFTTVCLVFQVDAPKSKAAAKANPMMNFFGSQAASELHKQ